ncbi:MAG: hypothetical protein EAX87_03660 [Candidatus Thorarchaeota archaeon]|nr:hypothetical protein [Candidatus Thorarchaeota archaeon]
MSTYKLMKNEIRMLYNQFKQTITTPSMLLFYGVSFFGVFFVSSVITGLVSFSPILFNFGDLLEDTISAPMIYAATAVFSASSVVSGYFGLGPAAVLTIDDENLMMSAPVKPHQIFLSRYIRRIVRKISFLTLGILAILPLLVSASLLFYSTVFLVIVIIIFLETNYFLGALSSYVRLWISQRTKRRIRHLMVVVLGVLVLLPAHPYLLSRFTALYVAPSNAFALFLIESTGIFAQGESPLYGVILLVIGFTICLLLTANITGYEHYEIYSATRGREETEGRFSRIIHGEVDFSRSRLNDPMLWIMLKDFWSRLRSPMQIWKYIYAVFGTAFVIYLNTIRPAWFPSVTIPPRLAFAVVPAFILMLILFIQMASVTSMLSFVDERENVYMLKASPFRTSDIVLSKYLLSLIEVAIAVIPACGFLIYFIQVGGYLSVVTLAIPLTILFTATGTAVGAYVPVFTNDPKTLPVPLAFSFPIINLGLGALLVLLVAFYSDSVLVLVILPLYTLSLVYCFLAASVHALDTYK